MWEKVIFKKNFKKAREKTCLSRWRGFERWQATFDSGLHRALALEKRKPAQIQHGQGVMLASLVVIITQVII